MADATTQNRDLMREIEGLLNSNSLRENLALLFIDLLHWAAPQAVLQPLQVGVPVKRTLTLIPIAQLGQVPVYRHDWEGDKPPTLTQRRAVQRALKPVAVEHLICYVTADGQQASFVWARPRQSDRGKAQKIELRNLPYEVGSPARTTIERLAKLAFAYDDFDVFGELQIGTVTDKLNAAFDVEAVTRHFFGSYREAFEEVERQITGITGDALRLFTQKLFNRLMFIVFLERKRWLSFQRRRDYLWALWQDHQAERASDPTLDFYYSRLHPLFFAGLNTQHEVNLMRINRGGFLATRIGHVPYLNGGLFEQTEDDRDSGIIVPDEALGLAINELFYRFNFTVTESTPLDIEVAIDPEMLGKIFEELVTGRHETGSYYTPKPVVAFMGREALKGYLQSACLQESSKALTAFVDEHDPAGLVNPEAVLDALKTVKVCDPACGSGAYLLGLLHELLDLRFCLFATRGLDPLTAYQRKLEIIQNNLYGVDLDPFAVNIARLRLWLSLVVDFEDGTPPPLPNLDFKIEVGDSLTAPDPSGGLQPHLFRHKQIEDYFRLKADYLMAHGSEKLTLRTQIEALRAEIAAWARPGGGDGGLDWAVEFAEVFAEGGFDVVLTNPPYVNMVAMEASSLHDRDALRARYRTARGGFDLFVPFMERGVQLLSDNGFLVYITPNKLLSAKYATQLRRYFAERMVLLSLTDLSHIPVFGAAVYPFITVAQKRQIDAADTLVNIYAAQSASRDEANLITYQHSTPIALTSITERSLWSPLVHPEVERMVPALLSQYHMRDIAIVSGAATVSEAYDWKEAVINDGSSLLRTQPGRYAKFIVSGNIRRYFHTWNHKKVRYIKTSYHQPMLETSHPAISVRRRSQIRGNKVIVSGMSKRPTAIWDKEGIAAGKSTVLIIPREVSGAYIAALVNSTVMKDLYDMLFGSLSLSGGYLRFGPPQIRALPVPDATPAQQAEIVALVDQILALYEQHGYPLPSEAAARIAELEQEIDERVAALYS